jgi:hypothetical protein
MAVYFNPAAAGARHGASGKDPDPPSPGITDHIDDAVFGTNKVAEAKQEAAEYHQAYVSAALSRIGKE